MSEANSRRSRSRHTDVTRFAAEVATAYAAFAQDVSYAVAMANSAVTIERKRGVWQARRDVKEAEAAAHRLCRDARPFTCLATSPCGTGDCKFAAGEMTVLDVAHCPGGTARPQASNPWPYTIEAAVKPLARHRAGTR